MKTKFILFLTCVTAVMLAACEYYPYGYGYYNQGSYPYSYYSPYGYEATRRSASQAAAATPSAAAQPSQPTKEEEFTGTVRSVSAVDVEKIKAGLPYGVPVPGRKGMVTSPYTPEDGKYVDVTGFASGSIVKDPYTGKLFLVP